MITLAQGEGTDARARVFILDHEGTTARRVEQDLAELPYLVESFRDLPTLVLACVTFSGTPAMHLLARARPQPWGRLPEPVRQRQHWP